VNVSRYREDSGDISMVIGAMYGSVLFIGINNCSTVQPIVAVERTVFYRERAAGMYSALPYAIAQVGSHLFQYYLITKRVLISLVFSKIRWLSSISRHLGGPMS
jgi:hypothetical protein